MSLALDQLSGKNRDEIRTLLGEPDSIAKDKSFIYDIRQAGNEKMKMTFVVKFSESGKFRGTECRGSSE